MKTIVKTLLASSLCVLIALPAHAGRYQNDDRFMDRMERQHERIVAGVKSGKLTRKEVRKLKKQQRNIRSIARVFREDEAISKNKRRILEKRLDRSSALIWVLKHNEGYHHASKHTYRDSSKDGKRHHGHSRHYQRDKYHEDDGGTVYRLSDGEDWPRYGCLSW